MHESLAAPRPEVSTAEAVRLAREQFGLEIASAAPLPGERDRNFALEAASGGRFVLKVMHPAEDPSVAEFQALALVHIGEVDPSLPVPRVVPPLRGESRVLARSSAQPSHWVRCVTHLGGKPLAGAASGIPLWRTLGTLAARLDRALADFRHPADDHELLWDLKRADRARGVVDAMPASASKELVGDVLERFERVVKPRLRSLRMQVIHNDFNPDNVLVASADPTRVVGIIDFGDAVRAPLSQEVATLAAYQAVGAGGPLDAAAHVTAAYHSVNALSEEEIAVVPDLIAVRLALSVAISSWRAALHPGETEYIVRSQPTVVANLRRLSGLTGAGDFVDHVARLGAAS